MDEAIGQSKILVLLAWNLVDGFDGVVFHSPPKKMVQEISFIGLGSSGWIQAEALLTQPCYERLPVNRVIGPNDITYSQNNKYKHIWGRLFQSPVSQVTHSIVNPQSPDLF
jgi:hypothetical protein